MRYCKCGCGQTVKYSDWAHGHANRDPERRKARLKTLEQFKDGTPESTKHKLREKRKLRVGKLAPTYGKKMKLTEEYLFQLKNRMINDNPSKRESVRKKISKKLKNRKITWADKVSKTKKEKYKNGEFVVWNKGLTKYDHPSVMALSYARSKQTKKNMSIVRKKYLANNPEALDKLIKSSKKRFDTKPELEMKKILTSLNIDFITQYFCYYIFEDIKCITSVDFKLKHYKILIEVDGDYWHNYPHGTEKDKIKTKHLESIGFKVLRFWERDIYNNKEYVVNKILSEVKKLHVIN